MFDSDINAVAMTIIDMLSVLAIAVVASLFLARKLRKSG